ncbi:MAG: LemA family protein [Nitrospirota bacterium]|nr:LemA family protein [Nitrospirota bacterium]
MPVVAILSLVLLTLLVIAWEVAYLTRLHSQRDEAWRKLEAELRERHTLATRLVTIATQYIPWRDPVVGAVTTCRMQAMNARTVGDRVAAEADLSWALARLLLTMEAQHSMERHADFVQVAEKLSKSENHVARLRLEYNRIVRLAESHLHHKLARLATRLHPIPAMDSFELDPLLARQSMMSALAAGMVSASH